MTTHTDVLVIGGGISGLTTAWWLAGRGFAVEVWEAAERSGGKIRSLRQDGYLLEQAATLLMNYRPEVAELVRAAGLDETKQARSPVAAARRYLLHQGRLAALPMRAGALAVSPVWSLRGKLRLLAEPFIPAKAREDETVSEFITRRLGAELLETAMEPFVAGTLAADPDRTHAAAALPRLTALERRYGSIAAGILAHRLLRRRTACRAETFSFEGGMETLIRSLADTPGVCVRTRHRIVELTRTAHDWRASAAAPDGERHVRAAQVVLAVPAGEAAALVRPLDRELAALLAGIGHAPLAVVHLGFDRDAVGHPLDGMGFLVPRRERLPLAGCLWMSTLFPDRAPPGKALLTAYLGGARAPEVADWSRDAAASAALAALHNALRLKGDPEMVRVDRHRRALPLYYGAYPARLRAIAARLGQLPGLHVEGNFHGGVSVRDRIVCAHGAARRIHALLTRAHPRGTVFVPARPAGMGVQS